VTDCFLDQEWELCSDRLKLIRKKFGLIHKKLNPFRTEWENLLQRLVLRKLLFNTQILEKLI
jgi:hypothetical protein